MQYFKVTGYFNEKQGWTDEVNEPDFKERKKQFKQAEIIKKFCCEIKKKSYFFLSCVYDDEIEIGVIWDESECVDKYIDKLVKEKVKYDLANFVTEEITLGCLDDLLSEASRNRFVDRDEVEDKMDIHVFNRGFMRNLEFGENIIEEKGKEEIYKDLNKSTIKEVVKPELARIYSCKGKSKCFGHPVHYFVETDDREIRKEIYKPILQALYEKGRIRSKRYSYMDISPDDGFEISSLENLYKSQSGGAIIMRCHGNSMDLEDSEFATPIRSQIECFTKIMMKHRMSVLTVFCLPRECTKLKDIFFEYLGSTCIVELPEELLYREKAQLYLKDLARDAKIKYDDSLINAIKPEKGYLSPELHNILDEWYNTKLKTDIFPQYKSFVSNKKEILKAQPKGNAYEELMELIGIKEAKKVINDALNYFKVQKLFADKGMKSETPCMHMVFTGNPGTCKTTVARLVARILQDNKILSKGELFEVTRADIVGKYVGHTAPLVKNLFKEAAGSVIFIDEAYSLVDDRDGMYGDEAINTIIAEMENHREDCVVIFAGYPDKMEKFLDKNPGLRSRIAYHVHFEDYDSDELCKIAKLIAKKKNLQFTEDALGKMHTIFDSARKQKEFGNGRFVRNVIEKARIAQSTRLLSMDYDSISENDIITIKADDISVPENLKQEKKQTLGFCG